MLELHEKQPMGFLWTHYLKLLYFNVVSRMEWNGLIYLSYLKLSTYLCNWEIEIMDFLTHPTKRSH